MIKDIDYFKNWLDALMITLSNQVKTIPLNKDQRLVISGFLSLDELLLINTLINYYEGTYKDFNYTFNIFLQDSLESNFKQTKNFFNLDIAKYYYYYELIYKELVND